MDVLIQQTEVLRNKTNIIFDECNGRHLTAKMTIKKGEVLGYYYGELHAGQGSDDENKYTLKLEYLDIEGGSYIDGTPDNDKIDDYRDNDYA